MDGIFISYRREDASGFAGRLHDRLVAEFGKPRVFMDVEHIEYGVDFVQAIEQAVGSCRVLIVVIGNEWLDSRDAAGRRRLDDPDDFVRLEVMAALARDIRVVPVLEDGVKMPRAEELPDALRSLARRNAITVYHDQWEGSIATLIHALRRLLGEGDSGRAPDAGGQGLVEPGGGGDGGAAGRTGGTGGTVHGSTGNAARWVTALGAVATLAAGGWWALGGRGPVPVPVPSGTLVAGASPAPPAPAAATPPAAAAPGPVTPPATTATPATPPPPAATASAPRAPASAPAARTVPAPPPKAAAAVPPSSPAPRPAPAPAPAPAVRAPVASPAPAPAPRAEAPAPVPAAAADPRLPQPGQSWTYRVRGKWPTSPNRSVVISVSEVRDGLVLDRLSDPAADAPVLRRSRAGQGGFVAWPGIGMEFSPYLAGTELLGWRGRGFSTPDLDPQWTQWHSQGQAIGHEPVTVPAGRFDAVKVEVWSSRTANGGMASINIEPVRVHYLVWYAPEVRRYVRMQRRVISAAGQEIERDLFELVARRGG